MLRTQATRRRRLDEAVGRILGVAPLFMRPPFGSYDEKVRTAAAIRGQAVVIWDFDSGDSTGSSAEQSKQAYSDLAARHPSTVLTLNHDVYGKCSCLDGIRDDV